MSAIDEIMLTDGAVWLDRHVAVLPDRAKFRAASALRSLKWANNIFDAGMPIPACFCALHSTEEAVAAFVSCAKEFGYVDAGAINIRDHSAKAAVSIIVEKVSEFLETYQVAVACDCMTDSLCARYVLSGQTYYNVASTLLLQFRDGQGNERPDFFDAMLNSFGGVGELGRAVRHRQEARNEIFYATKFGLPTGFSVPDMVIATECRISLALIWAAIDVSNNKGKFIPFINQAIKTAVAVIDECKKKNR